MAYDLWLVDACGGDRCAAALVAMFARLHDGRVADGASPDQLRQRHKLSDLRRKTGFSRSAVSRAMGRIERLGYILAEQARDRAYEFRLQPDVINRWHQRADQPDLFGAADAPEGLKRRPLDPPSRSLSERPPIDTFPTVPDHPATAPREATPAAAAGELDALRALRVNALCSAGVPDRRLAEELESSREASFTPLVLEILAERDQDPRQEPLRSRVAWIVGAFKRPHRCGLVQAADGTWGRAAPTVPFRPAPPLGDWYVAGHPEPIRARSHEEAVALLHAQQERPPPVAAVLRQLTKTPTA